MEAEIFYINLAFNKPGFESWLCHFLTLYPWAKSILFPLHQNISIFLSKRQLQWNSYFVDRPHPSPDAYFEMYGMDTGQDRLCKFTAVPSECILLLSHG